MRSQWPGSHRDLWSSVAFIGYLVAGPGGATAAALGIFLPVYLVVVVLAPSYKRWAKNPQLNAFVRGVTAGATGAIAGAGVVRARRSVYDLPTILICLLSLGILFRWRVPEPVLIALPWPVCFYIIMREKPRSR
jgi:chromate transporter